jgi:uncharacterized protein YjiK
MIVACSSKRDESKDKPKDKSKENSEQKTQDKFTPLEGSALESYDISTENPQVLTLTNDLLEISGITFTDDDRLFAHGDEDADIFELDFTTGKVIKRFSLGDLLVVKGDFEDIAFAKGKFYLVESNGKLYEFSEGSNGSFAGYKTYKTSLGSKNDVEGLCYDKETNSLLLACKGSAGKDYKKEKAVYSFSLGDMNFNETPRFLISAKDIKNNTEEGKFNPSGIARHPAAGTFFIIAAQGNTIVEIDKDGRILNQKDLPSSIHKQAEGIAFKKDGTLYISNEGRNKTPCIVVYPMKK